MREGARDTAPGSALPWRSPLRPEGSNGNGEAAADVAFRAGSRAASSDHRPRWWRDQRRRRLLAAADAAVAVLIGFAVLKLNGEPLAWAPVATVPALVTAKLIGLYDTDHRAIRHLTIDELPTIAAWCAVVTVICGLVIPGTMSVPALVAVIGPAVLVAVALRGAARMTWRRATPAERTLVVGRGEPAAAIARKIELFADMHLQLERVEDPAIHLERRNGDEEAAMDAALSGIDRVVLAWADANPLFIERLLAHCRRREVKLSVISPFRGRARPALQLSQVADLPVLEYNTWDVPRSTSALKRAIDIACSAAGLAVLAPAFAAVALAIKLDDRGPVLFRQRRIGKDGKPFTIVKFRSMCVDAEQRLASLVDLEALDDPMFKLCPDPRVTRVGRFLRRFSLDELPQLVNVLRGTMSLVGPRPEAESVARRYGAEHTFRFQVKPGVTGPMQVFGRGELSFEERLAVEIDYIENVSVARDLKLLAQTLPAVLRGTGAF